MAEQNIPSLRPDYTKINLLKRTQAKLEQSKYIRGLCANYKAVIHDLELLKETKYITDKEFEEEVKKLKDRFIELAMSCED